MSLNRQAILKGRRPIAVHDDTPEDPPTGVVKDIIDAAREELAANEHGAESKLGKELIQKFALLRPLLTGFTGDEYKLGTGLSFGLWKDGKWALREGFSGFGLNRPTQPVKLVVVNHQKFRKFGFQVKLPVPLQPGETTNTLPAFPHVSYWLPGGERHVFVSFQLDGVYEALKRDAHTSAVYLSRMQTELNAGIAAYEKHLKNLVLLYCDTSKFEKGAADDE